MINQSNKIITSNFKYKICEVGRERGIDVHMRQGYWAAMGRAEDGLRGNQRENFTGK